MLPIRRLSIVTMLPTFLLDYLFGTAVPGQKIVPEQYGVVGDYMPLACLKQQLYPLGLKDTK